jgi:nucleotide-binding universal stress UspA family protein
MDYRTILVHAAESRSADEHITFAAQFALRHDAHLVGVVPTGILRFVHSTPPDGYLGDLTPMFHDLRAMAQQTAARFETLVRQAGVPSFEHRIGDEEPGYALASQAMYADLVVVGQSDPEDPATAHAAIPEYVALHASCPVLVLPYAGEYRPDFERILIGWNASPESARAVKQALPLLVRASEVEIAVFDGEVDDADDLGGPDIAVFLARHGIKVTLWKARAGGDAANALLSRASAWQADLLVMGCYGHTRLREILLGGASRTLLHSMTVPTLMAH